MIIGSDRGAAVIFQHRGRRGHRERLFYGQLWGFLYVLCGQKFDLLSQQFTKNTATPWEAPGMRSRKIQDPLLF